MYYEAKDEMRINGILARSKGSARKAEALAQQMANSIHDVSKARRRASAAGAVHQHVLASFFWTRVGQLGGRA